MFKTLLIAGVALGLAGCAGSGWKPKQAPLMTRWAKDVNANPHPEYPRPQMVRSDWKNLNGFWEYAITPKDASQPSAYEGQILVPFPIESALSGVMRSVDDNSRLWYRRTISVPRKWRDGRVMLNFGAVDWETVVYVNGTQVGAHRGGYDGFSCDITDALKGEDNEVIVSVFDPTDRGTQPRGKQVLRPGGIWYTPTSGIWQTIWIEPVPAASIADLKIVPDLDQECVRVTVFARNAADGYTAEAQIEGGGMMRGGVGAELVIPLKRPRLWTPDNPYLYDLKVSLLKGSQSVDSVGSYFGMRKISVAKDEKGVNRIMLNNKFVFQVGFLDQGFWPDGLYTAPSDEALRYDVEMTKKMGMNMARKHVKVEPERWYYWCDKLGLLVWQDMPSGDAHAPNGKGEISRTPASAQQFERELRRLIEGRRNHPSIVMWVVFNEGWGQYDTVRLTNWVKENDPSRLANCASGWNDFPAGDVHDIHAYPGPAAPKPEEKRAMVLGEFGGLGLPLEGHTWQQKGSWGYRSMSSPKRLTDSYVKLLKKAYELKDDPGLSAIVYTQTTDVEVEVNGLMTYDRAIVKPDLRQIEAANLGKPIAGPAIVDVVPTGQLENVAWKYTTQQPSEDWFRPDFDASSWKQGNAGFGTRGTPGSAVKTQWNTPDIWIRREFELPSAKLNNPVLMLHHDDDAEVYVNGVLAAKVDGFTSDYQEFDISPEARKTLKPGRNVIAVHCHQKQGGQYIDVGLVDSK